MSQDPFGIRQSSQATADPFGVRKSETQPSAPEPVADIPTVTEDAQGNITPVAPTPAQQPQRRYLEKDGKYFLDNGNGKLAPITKTTYDFGVKNVKKEPVHEFSPTSKALMRKAFDSPIVEDVGAREAYYTSMAKSGYDQDEVRHYGESYLQAKPFIQDLEKRIEQNPTDSDAKQKLQQINTVLDGEEKPKERNYLNEKLMSHGVTPPTEQQAKTAQDIVDVVTSPAKALVEGVQHGGENLAEGTLAFDRGQYVKGMADVTTGILSGAFGALNVLPPMMAFTAGVTAAEKVLPEKAVPFIMNPVTSTLENLGMPIPESETGKSLYELAKIGENLLVFHGASKLAKKIAGKKEMTGDEVKQAAEIVQKSTPQEVQQAAKKAVGDTEYPQLTEASILRQKQLDLIIDQRNAVAKYGPEAGMFYQPRIDAFDLRIKELKDENDANNVHKATNAAIDHHIDNEKSMLKELIADAQSEDGKKLLQEQLDELNKITESRNAKPEKKTETDIDAEDKSIPEIIGAAEDKAEQVLSTIDNDAIYKKEIEDLLNETINPTQDAIQEPSPSGVLQHPSQGDGTTGGERGRVEQGQQGQETPIAQQPNASEQNAQEKGRAGTQGGQGQGNGGITPSRQFAIDFVTNGLIETLGYHSKADKTMGERLDLGMNTKERNKAIADIKAGKLDTAPAKRMLDRIEQMHKDDSFQFITGTGGGAKTLRVSKVDMENTLRDVKAEREEASKIPDDDAELGGIPKDVADLIVENNIHTFEDAENLRHFPLSSQDVDRIQQYFPREANAEPKNSVVENPQGEKNTPTSEAKVDLTPKEKAKAKLDEARAAFRKAGGLSSGGLESLPEFINLIKAYVDYGITSAQEAWKQFTEDFPESKVGKKDFEDAWEKMQPKEEQSSSSEATSTKNAVVNAERLKQGLPPIDKTKVDAEAIFEQVKKHLSDPETYQSTDKNVNPHVLAKWSAEHPSEPISAWQEMLLASERDKLNASLEEAEKAKQKAMEDGDAKGVLDANAIIENKIELLRMNDKANSYRGTQWSGIGRIRQRMIQEDYSFKGLLRKYNVVNHFEPIPKDVQTELEARGRKIEELQDKLEKEQKKTSSAVQDKKIKEASKQLADFIRKGKLSRPSTFSAATPASLVWDAALEVVAKTIETGGTIAQAVSDGLNHIKSSDWYKGLSDSDKAAREKDYQDWWDNRELQSESKEQQKINRLQKQLDDLLEGKTKESRKKTEDSPEAKSLKEEIRKTKEELGLIESRPLPKTPVGQEGKLKNLLEKWQEKNATGDYEEEPRVEREDTPIERRLKIQIAEEKRKADRIIEARRLKDRPWYKKLADFLSEYQHLSVITSPRAIGKIATNVPMRLVQNTIYDAARGTVLNLPGLRMAESAPAEFNANMKSIAKRWSTITSADAWKDTWNTIIGKTSKADILKAKDLEDRNPNWGKGLDVLRQLLYSTGVGIHKALKDPVFRAEYEASLKRYNESLIGNHDITDPDIVQTAKSMAVADGLAAQFMQDNNFVNRWRQAVGDATDKKTYPGKEAIKFGAKILNPVVKLPANYAREILNLQTGLFQAMYKGAEMIADKSKRTPEEKNKLTKKILVGGAGALALSYGWNHYKNFGGYYTSSKDLKNELPIGSVKIGNEVFGETVVGKVFIHFPLIAVMQIAATARRKYEEYLSKGDSDALKKGLGYGAAATFEDLPAMENLSTTGEKILHGNIEGVAKDAAKSFVPNVVNYFTEPSKEQSQKQKEEEKNIKQLQERIDKRNKPIEQKHEHILENRETRTNRLLHDRELREFAKKNHIQYLPPRY